MKILRKITSLLLFIGCAVILAYPIQRAESAPAGQAGTILVDDSMPEFQREGPADFWYPLNSGLGNESIWTYCAAAKASNSGFWVPPINHSGKYKVQVYIPPDPGGLPKPFSEAARYNILHGSALTTMTINQAASTGWVDLGEYDFYATGNEYVQLTDQTGEPDGSHVVIFDAIQLIPVEGSTPELDAAPNGNAVYDVALPGETAELHFQVRNTGLSAWQGADFILAGQAGNPSDAPAALPIEGVIEPGKVAEWTISVPVSGAPGLRTLTYQMTRSGQPFGKPVSGYIFVLTEQMKGLETQIRAQMDHWRDQGKQAMDALLAQIVDSIQKEVQKQAESWIQKIFDQCRGALGVGGIVLGFSLYRSRKKPHPAG